MFRPTFRRHGLTVPDFLLPIVCLLLFLPAIALAQPDPTTTSLSISSPPAMPASSSVYQEPIAVGAILSATDATGDVAGTITFYWGTTALAGDSCSAAVSSFATYSCNITPTSTSSSATITAQFVGASGASNEYDNSSDSTGVSHSVVDADTSLIVEDGSLATPTVYQQAFSASATLAVTAPGSGTPTGTVTLSWGTDSCTAAVTGAGTYSCNITASSVATQVVTASYSGDANFNGSNDATGQSHVVNQADATVAVQAGSLGTPTTYQAPFTATATVVAVAPGGGTPTGAVTLSWGTDTCAAVFEVASSSYQCDITPTSVGTNAVTASYAGDANFNPDSDSVGVDHTVSQGSTSIVVEAGSLATDSAFPDAFSASAALTLSGGSSGTPTGTVTLTWGSDSCATAVNGIGSYSCDITPTAVGTNAVTAAYDGDVNFDGDTDTTGVGHQVNRLVDVSISKSNGVNGVSPNQLVRYDLLLTHADAGSGLGSVSVTLDDAFVPELLKDTVSVDGNSNPICLADDPDEPCWRFCPTANVLPDACGAVEVQSGSGDISGTIIELTEGGTVTVEVYASVSAAAIDGSTISNTATISVNSPVPTDHTINNSGTEGSTDDDVVGISTDLVVSKTDSLTEAVPGESHSYVVTVRNDGQNTANGIQVTDNFPIFDGTAVMAGFAFGEVEWVCEATPGACCLSNGSNDQCGTTGPTTAIVANALDRLIDLPPAAEATFTITGTIHPEANGTLTNSATGVLPANVDEADASNNIGTDDDTVLVAEADLALTKSVTMVIEGATAADPFVATYLIEISNNGPSFAAGISLSDPFDDSNFVTNSVDWNCVIVGAGVSSSCGVSSASDQANLSTSSIDLLPGDKASFVVTAEIDSAATGLIPNEAMISWSGDTSPLNNVASANARLTGEADLTITNTDGLTSAVPGEQVTYTVQISNAGPDTVFDAMVSNLFPPEVESVAWSCDASTPIPGDLAPLATYASPDLFQLSDLALSADGAHVYATATGADALLVYSRESVPGASFGQLSAGPIQSEFDGVASSGPDPVDGLAGAAAVAVSPDGAHVYIAGSADGAVGMFQRDNDSSSPNFGKLDFGDSFADSALTDVSALAFGPTIEHIYTAGSSAVSAWERDPASGRLTLLDSESFGAAQAVLDVSSDGEHLYFAGDTNLQLFDIDGDSASLTFGQLTAIPSASVTLSAAAVGLVVSPTGNNVYVLAADSVVTLFDRDPADGSLTEVTTYSVPAGPADITVSPDGEHLIVTATSGNALIVYRRAVGGTLSQQDQLATALAAPGPLAFSPDGRHVLTGLPGPGSVGATGWIDVFERRAPDPLFALIEVDRDDDPGVDGLFGAASVAVSPVDRAHVYVAALGEDKVSIFARDSEAGVVAGTEGQHLTYVGQQLLTPPSVGVKIDPTDVVLSRDGNHVLLAGREVDTIYVYARDSGSGLLSELPAEVDAINLNGVSALAFAPDSSHLYSAGRYAGAVGVYDFDVVTGGLTFKQALSNGSDGVQALAGITDLIVTADGAHVVAVSRTDGAVVVFERNTDLSPASEYGKLAFVQALTLDSTAELVGIVGSRNGNHVYVTGTNSDTLYVLARDADPASVTFGQVRLIQSLTNTVDGVGGLDGARGVAISRDGTRVYVAASDGNQIGVFGRNADPTNAEFGQLEFLDAAVNDVDGVSGLEQIYDVAVSGDNRHVYSAALTSDTLASFVLGLGSSCTAIGSGDINDMATIGVGGTVTYTAVADLRSDAIFGNTQCREAGGLIPNVDDTAMCSVATVVAPVGFDDPDESNNESRDDNTVLTPEADISISKSNDQVSAISGQEVTYTIEVENNGPSDAINGIPSPVTINDILDPTMFDQASVSWSCEAVGSGSLAFAGSKFDLEVDDIAVDDSVQGLDGVTAVATGSDPDGAGPLGEYVYAVSVLDSSLVVFERDLLTAELTPLLTIDAAVVPELSGARDVLVSADGRFVYVASQVADAVLVFEAVNNAGALDLQLVETQVNDGGFGLLLDQPLALALSADPAQATIFVAAGNSGSVLSFSRNPVDGTLSLQDIETDGVDDGGGVVSGQLGAVDLVASGDGGHLYVAGLTTGSIVIHQLSGAQMTWQQTLTSASAGVELGGIAALASSAEGEQIYTALGDANAIAVFARATDGSLTALQTVRDSDAGVSGLVRPTDLQVSPDGFHVYGSSANASSLFFLRRDENNGQLAFSGLVQNGKGTIVGIAGATNVALAADGSAVYVAGTSDDAVAAFQRRIDSVCAGSGSGDIVNEPIEVAAGGKVVFTVSANVAAGASGTLSNTATITAPIDPTPGNNASTDQDVLDPEADLLITKTDGRAEFDGLAGAAALVRMDAGTNAHIYVAGSDEAAIAILQDEGNALRYIGRVENGLDGIAGLLGVSDIVGSADGNELFTVAALDNALVNFERDSDSGELTSLQLLNNGVAGVSGLSAPGAIALSSDQEHLYVTSGPGSSLAFFDRNLDGANAGLISFSQVLQNGADGVVGMADPSDLLVSNDGLHVYVAAPGGDSIVQFERIPTSGSSSFGQLSYLATVTDQALGVDGLAGVNALALSSTDTYLYALGPDDQSLVVFERDLTDGSLTFVQRVADGVGGVVGLSSATSLQLGPDDRHLYVAASGSDAILRFGISAADGTLSSFALTREGDPGSVVGEVINGLVQPQALAFDAAGEQLIVAAADPGSVALFQRDVDGSLDYVESLIDGGGGVAPGEVVEYRIEVVNLGPSDVPAALVTDNFPNEFAAVEWSCQAEPGASCRQDCVLGSPTNACTGDIAETVGLPAGKRLVFTARGLVRPGVQGSLSNTATVEALGGISDLVQSNNSSTDDDTVLSPLADVGLTLSMVPAQPVPGQSVELTLAATNAGPSFARNNQLSLLLPEALSGVSWTCDAQPSPGLLGLVELYSGNIAVVAATVLSPDDNQVYALGSTAAGTGVIAQYQRDSSDGSLAFDSTYVDGQDGIGGLAGAAAGVFSADGLVLYVAGTVDDSVAVFTRDPSSGDLTFLERQVDGLGGVTGLGGPSGLTLSPDGAHLYAAAAAQDSVVVFNRNSDGSLSYRSTTTQTAGVDGLNGVRALAVSSDGRYLYTAGESNDAVGILQRDLATGDLSFVDVLLNFQVPGEALSQPADVVLSADGQYLLVAAQGADTVSVFSLDSSDGSLTFVSAIVDGVAGASGLLVPESIAVADQGRVVYVASSGSAAIAAFNFAEGELSQFATYPTSDFGAGAPVDLAISADQAYLYSATGLSGAIIGLAIADGSTCTGTGAGTLVDTIDLSPGGTATYTISALIEGSARGQLPVAAEVVLSSVVADPDLSNNQFALTPTPELNPNLEVTVTKTDGLSRIIAGADLEYAIDVSNVGISDAVALGLQDFPPIYSNPFAQVTAGLMQSTINWACAADDPLALDYLREVADDPILTDAKALSLSPDGLRLFVAGGASDSVAVYSIAGDGSLQLLDRVANGDAIAGGTVTNLLGPAEVVSNASAEFIYVSAETGDAIAAFAVDPASGQLSWLGAVVNSVNAIGLDGPTALAISPDGLHLYAAAGPSNAIAAFDIEAGGSLTFIERIRDGFGLIPEVNVIAGVSDLVIRGDGEFVYAVGPAGNSLATFTRNATTGQLLYKDVIRDGETLTAGGTADGLAGASELVLGPNLGHLYVAGPDDGAIVTFALNAASGLPELTQVSSGIADIAGLAITSDGGLVYGSSSAGTVAAFQRDAVSGTLNSIGGFAGDPALTNPTQMTIDGGDASIYGLADGALFRLLIKPFAVCPALATTSLDVEMALAAGASAQFTMSGAVDPRARGTLSNTISAILEPLSTDSDLTDNVATDQTIVDVVTDLSISKTVSAQEVVAGESLVFTIEVANTGPSAALGARVIDLFGPDLTMINWSCAPGAGASCRTSGSGDIDELIDLPLDGSVVFTVNATVLPQIRGLQSNSAAIAAEAVTGAGTVTDPDPSNNSATAEYAVVGVADIALEKTQQNLALIAGDPVSYELLVSNTGPSDALQVELLDLLAVELLDPLWTCSGSNGATCAALQGSGDINQQLSIPAGGEVLVELTGMLGSALTQGTTIANAASVALLVDIDPDSSNNQSEVSDTVTTSADLSINKTSRRGTIDLAGDRSNRYFLAIDNAGPSDALDVVVSDMLPAGIAGLSAARCSGEQQVALDYSCVLPRLAAGSSAMIELDVIISTSAVEPLINTGSVSSATDDPVAANNSSSATVNFATENDVQVEITDSQDVAAPGDQLVYMVSYRNLGSSPATDVLVTTALPAELIDISWVCVQGDSCAAGGNGELSDLIDLDVAQTVVYEVTATIDPAVAAPNPLLGVPVVAIAQADSPGDIDLGNNTAEDTTSLFEQIFSDGFEMAIVIKHALQGWWHRLGATALADNPATAAGGNG